MTSSLPVMLIVSEHRPGRPMGIGHYERLLLKHMGSQPRRPMDMSILYSGRAKGDILNAGDISEAVSNASFAGVSFKRVEHSTWTVARAFALMLQRGRKADLYHCLSLAFPAPVDRPSIYTIHDLPCERFTDEAEKPAWSKKATNAARFVHVPSEFAKREMIELLSVDERKIRVIPYGCENEFFNDQVVPLTDAELESLGIRRPFVLYAGGFTQRKNVAAMLESWRIVGPEYPDVQLVMAGPAERLAPLVSKSKAANVHLAGYVERTRLPSVMRAAELLLCPSIYEGFGLPPLEAMACAVPVVAVRAGAIPEVVGQCAELAENGSAEAIALALRSVLSSKERRAELRNCGPDQAAKFSWPSHAAAMLDLYEEALR